MVAPVRLDRVWQFSTAGRQQFSSRKPTSHCANMQDYGLVWGGEDGGVLANRILQLLQKS